MCLRCHERQRQKNKTKRFEKFFKNQYGQSVWALEERVNKKKRSNEGYQYGQLKDYKKSNFFFIEEFDHGSD